MPQWTVLNGNLTRCNLINLDTNGHHRITETIKLGFRFTFGWFNHQRSGHRETHRRRMESVIH